MQTLQGLLGRNALGASAGGAGVGNREGASLPKQPLSSKLAGPPRPPSGPLPSLGGASRIPPPPPPPPPQLPPQPPQSSSPFGGLFGGPPHLQVIIICLGCLYQNT